ncbi:unnamed protein product [Clonostachys solani]|uniref:Uncharacterized protein n=1 Tax=Clonostachys solani TaxID=160281 RepID=A0A9P0EN76_9HYPO|nr:unnamed protein product [Clonostachys solani]
MAANFTEADIDQFIKDLGATLNDPTAIARYKICSDLGYELFPLNDDILKLGEQVGKVNREYRTSKNSAKPTQDEYNAWIKAAQLEGLDVSQLEFEKCGKVDFLYRKLQV